MTSDGGYPDFDNSSDLLDRWRCPAVQRDPDHAGVARRCQLYDHHDGGHAHAEHVSTKPWRSIAHRWTDDGSTWIDEPIVRLRWCCLFSP